MNRTEKQKMLAGELYRPDAEIAADQALTKAWLVRYNAALAQPVSERHALLSGGDLVLTRGELGGAAFKVTLPEPPEGPAQETHR